MAICAFLLFKEMAKNYMKIEADHEDNFWWYRDYDSSELSIFGLVLLIISVIMSVTSVISIPINIGKMFKWLIVPEIKYLEMLKRSYSLTDKVSFILRLTIF